MSSVDRPRENSDKSRTGLRVDGRAGADTLTRRSAAPDGDHRGWICFSRRSVGATVQRRRRSGRTRRCRSSTRPRCTPTRGCAPPPARSRSGTRRPSACRPAHRMRPPTSIMDPGPPVTARLRNTGGHGIPGTKRPATSSRLHATCPLPHVHRRGARYATGRYSLSDRRRWTRPPHRSPRRGPTPWSSVTCGTSSPLPKSFTWGARRRG